VNLWTTNVLQKRNPNKVFFNFILFLSTEEMFRDYIGIIQLVIVQYSVWFFCC